MKKMYLVGLMLIGLGGAATAQEYEGPPQRAHQGSESHAKMPELTPEQFAGFKKAMVGEHEARGRINRDAGQCIQGAATPQALKVCLDTERKQLHTLREQFKPPKGEGFEGPPPRGQGEPPHHH